MQAVVQQKAVARADASHPLARVGGVDVYFVREFESKAMLWGEASHRRPKGP